MSARTGDRVPVDGRDQRFREREQRREAAIEAAREVATAGGVVREDLEQVEARGEEPARSGQHHRAHVGRFEALHERLELEEEVAVDGVGRRPLEAHDGHRTRLDVEQRHAHLPPSRAASR
jgi:hypothetical protein